MKYAFFVLFSSIAFSTNASALTITSFSDSPALMNVLEFVKDSGADLKVSNRVSEKKLTITSSEETKCTDVPAALVQNEIENSIQNVLRYYPDEELPLDDAYNDLQTLLGSFIYKKCIFYTSNDHMKLKTSYFYNAPGTVHIKVDTITLLTE
jgi:hypothetical protein